MTWGPVCGPCPSGYVGTGSSGCYPNVCLVNNGGCDPLVTCNISGTGATLCGDCPEGYVGTGTTGCMAACGDGACQRGGTCHQGSTCLCPKGTTGKFCERTFSKLSARATFCGLLDDGKVSCWHQAFSPPGTFVDVVVGSGYRCALDADGRATCWDGYPWMQPPDDLFDSLAVGFDTLCGVRKNGTAACWGSGAFGQLSVPGGTFRALAPSSWDVCGIREDGTLECWGRQNGPFSETPSSPPPGTFEMIRANGITTCALSTDGSIQCFGFDTFGGELPPDGPFLTFDISDNYGCGIRIDGTLACWGQNFYGRTNPPAGTYREIATSIYGGCAIRTDDVVACWGLDSEERLDPPNGEFGPGACSGVSCANGTCVLGAALHCACNWGFRRRSDDSFSCYPDPCYDGQNGGCVAPSQCYPSDQGAVCEP
jgi:hypothetical protein